MTTKRFIENLEEILAEYPHEKKEINGRDRYLIKTTWGTLQITPDPTPRINSYTIFMMFTDGWVCGRELTDHSHRFKLATGVSRPPSASGKWNLHFEDPEDSFIHLEERLTMLQYLKYIEV